MKLIDLRAKNMKKIIFVAIALFLLFNIANIQAIGLNNAGTEINNAANTIGYNTTGSNDLSTVVGNLIKIILAILGVLFLILIIISGIQWMSAGGNDDLVKKSKGRIKNATIGLGITLLAYMISYYVVYLFTNQTLQ